MSILLKLHESVVGTQKKWFSPVKILKNITSKDGINLALEALNPVFIFFPVKPKSARDTKIRDFVTGNFDFSRADFRKLSRAGQNFHGHFFRNFHGQVGNFTGISKSSCHGHFYVCHGHFCALISIFLIYSSHNKGDIWTLTFRELTIFSKKKHVPWLSS